MKLEEKLAELKKRDGLAEARNAASASTKRARCQPANA
jgi:hypothetical protein